MELPLSSFGLGETSIDADEYSSFFLTETQNIDSHKPQSENIAPCGHNTPPPNDLADNSSKSRDEKIFKFLSATVFWQYYRIIGLFTFQTFLVQLNKLGLWYGYKWCQWLPLYSTSEIRSCCEFSRFQVALSLTILDSKRIDDLLIILKALQGMLNVSTISK